MTFQEFISQEGAEIEPLRFVVLDEPVDIVARPNRYREFRFKVIAMAITAPRSQQPFLFALAVSGVFPSYRFTTLSRYFGGAHRDEDPKKGWIVTKGALFHHWVQDWLMNHPYQMFTAGAALERASRK